MIELTREEFSMIIMDLLICTEQIPVSVKTHDFISFLWESYKENRHITTIGVK
jgi:hypothetical protein